MVQYNNYSAINSATKENATRLSNKGMPMLKKYILELEGQRDFYENYLKLIDSSLSVDEVLSDNTDGVLKGNLLEFKVNINDLNSVLFQAIKYLSAFRIKGKPVPANIILISLNDGKAYCYHSFDYLTYIERVYMGSASKDNSGFVGGHPFAELYYIENQSDEAKLISLLRENNFTKIHIDENNIVGWATSYYKQYPNARKSDFIGDLTGKVKIIGEIRKPDKFKDYIYPYEGATNTKFQYLMDKLNDAIQKKNLGAFYTPTLYAEKSLELVREAIRRVPEGNDYIILDRCAGTGNLELGLTDEEKSHAILSTVEYYEYKVLLEILGDKVRYIIPPTEKEDTFNMGLVRGADALSEEYINNPVIKQYIDNPKCTIILFENPPFAETTSLEHQRLKQSKGSSSWKNSFVVTQMKKEVKGAISNDLGNAFIWSGFKYYLRQSTDSYIVYSPVKYWKAQHLINKQFIYGFAYNRRFFHTNTDACIMVALWANIDVAIEELSIHAYNISDDNELIDCGTLPVKRIHELYSTRYYEKKSFDNSSIDGILIGLNGLEADSSVKRRIKPLYSDEMLGYLVADSVGFDNPDAKSSLLVAGRYNGNGCYLHKNNFLNKLPLFAASRYITYNRAWTERARIMKSADGYKRYSEDIKQNKLSEYLLKVLLFTIFEPQNHMRSFTGSDGRFYRNELCLDTSNGDTLASLAIKGFTANNEERELLLLWDNIIELAKKTKNYDCSLTYGIYQINVELDTYVHDDETDKNIYDYPELHGNLQTLKKLIKDYYNTEIVPTLFEYEFLK